MHYKVEFTADEEYMSLLEEARDLLAHVNPTRDFVEVQRRALELLVAQLRKRKHGARAGAVDARAETSSGARDGNDGEATAVAAQPLPVTETDVGADAAADLGTLASSMNSHAAPLTRRPGAAVVRTVWQRDRGRCTYVDPRGQRCRETSLLEYHHEHAWALGGATTVENISLRCRAHNALAGEEDFGRESVVRRRGGHGRGMVMR